MEVTRGARGPSGFAAARGDTGGLGPRAWRVGIGGAQGPVPGGGVSDGRGRERAAEIGEDSPDILVLLMRLIGRPLGRRRRSEPQ